jgi:hypothetical protein
MSAGIRTSCAVLLGLALLCSCGRETGKAAAGPVADPGKASQETADEREAFSSSGLIPASAFRGETISVLSGKEEPIPRAGPVSFDGGRLTVAALRLAGASGGERLLGFDTEGRIGFAVALPAPALAIAAAGKSIVAACADGSLMAFALSAEDPAPVVLWRRSGAAIFSLVPLPSGKIAAAADDGSLAVFSASSGVETWHATLAGAASGLAYGPGLVLLGVGWEIAAFTEKEGNPAWRAQLSAPAAAVSAGSGIVAALDEKGKLYFFDSADGRRLSESAGPYDPDLPAAIGPGYAVAAYRSGGGARIAPRGGAVLGTWKWKAEASFLVTDGSRIIVCAGSRLIVQKIDAYEDSAGTQLASRAFARPVADALGLVLLCVDGSLVREGEAAAKPASLIEPLMTPDSAVVEAIASGLERYRSRGSTPLGDYLRFDLPVNGMPVAARPRFTAYRLQFEKGSRATIEIGPDGADAIIAVFDESGREIESNRDELGSPGRLARFFEKGRTYWVAVGHRGLADDSAEAPRFAFYLKTP